MVEYVLCACLGVKSVYAMCLSWNLCDSCVFVWGIYVSYVCKVGICVFMCLCNNMCVLCLFMLEYVYFI